jgi:RepB DNA-primase from phage plasmid
MNSKPFSPLNDRPPALSERSKVAGYYIRENFEPDDRLAVVLSDKWTKDIVQRIAMVDKITADDFQAWLRYKNTNGYEVYISMNALARNANGRTKADVETVRHVYLDFDDNGTAAVEKLLAREDLPKLNYLVNTSPDKWQVVWKVQGFEKEQAESLQRGLAQAMGADPAATDCSRVLRLPGFYNHKYANPFWVASQAHSTEVYGPERFPEFSVDERSSRALPAEPREKGQRPTVATGGSQSERDWAYAKRALMRGDPEEMVILAIASYRRYDKHNPRYYAELTVRKAAQELSAEIPQKPDSNTGPER